MTDQSDIGNLLCGFAGKLTKLRINRVTSCDRVANGFVLVTNAEWCLLWQFHDFFPDGFALMRVDGIASIRCGEYEKHWTKMLADEGIAGFLPKLDIVIGDLSSMLSQLQQTNRNFVIECESRDDDIEDFYIGRILTIHDQFCEFANFDGLGPWDDEPHTIQPDDITRIQWDTPYANTFSRHLAGPCPFFETGEVGCSLELGGKIRGGGTARCGLVPPHSDECAYGGSLR